MRRLLPLLTLLLLLPVLALGEGTPSVTPPATLPECTSVDEVMEFLLMPDAGAPVASQRGYIRYISQNRLRDPFFCTDYWLGGEKGSLLDLTLKVYNGRKLAYHTGSLCTRAVYSMALGYLGIDVTPGSMSAMTNTRNLDDPYDDFSATLGVERVIEKSHVFNTMMENYMTDPSYSPVYLYFLRPDGTTHAVLVVATIPDKGRFLVVDPNPPQSEGKLYYVYFVSLNKARSKIINSTFRQTLSGSQVLQLYQWRLTDSPAPQEE